jgi:hypothetical protein
MEPTSPVGPNEVRVQRMDVGKSSATLIIMMSLRETTMAFHDDKAPYMRTLSVTLTDNDKEKIEQSIVILGDTPVLSLVTTAPHNAQDYRITAYEPNGTLRGSALRKFRSGKMEETLFDAEGKPAPQDQRSRILDMRPPEPVDLAKMPLQKQPIHGDVTKSDILQNPNEIRVEYFELGNGIGQAIYTPNLCEDRYFENDGKTLRDRTVTATLLDNDTERVFQSYFIRKNIVAFTQTTRLNKKTNELTDTYYTPKGNLLYSQRIIPGKIRKITDSAGNTITLQQADQLLHTPNPDQIDIDKVPLQDMTNPGKAPASPSTPQAE